MNRMDTGKAAGFILGTARPLEKSLYRFYFEGGAAEDVIKELSAFQNPDGGFGHGLEADNWNPASNPIAVNDALIILYRTGALRPGSGIAGDMLDGIERYLRSRDSFDEKERKYLFAIDSNKDAPHAIWWEKNDGDGISGYNPTVSLAAFMACRGGDRECFGDIYSLTSIIKSAAEYLSSGAEMIGDELKCYMLCLALLESYGISDITNLDTLRQNITRRAEDIICPDTGKYGVEYVCAPSDLFAWGDPSLMSDKIKALAEAEINMLGGIQQEDGGFDISWKWYTDYPEFETARSWWRPRITLDKLLFSTRSGI